MQEQIQQLVRAGDVRGALNLAVSLCRDNPGDIELWLVLATLQARSNDLGGVVATFTHILSVQPSNESARYNLAVALHTLGRTGEAIGEYEKLLRLNPVHVSGLNNLGALLLDDGQAGRASTLLERAVEYSPENALAHNSLGLCYDGLSRHADARRQYQEALRQSPGFAAARCNLARSLYLEGHTVEALDELGELLAENPAETDGLLMKATILGERGESAAAVRHLESAVDRCPGSIELAYRLAGLYTAAGRTEDAIRMYRLVLERNPRHTMSLNNLGSLMRDIGRTPEAIELLERAVDLAPEAAEIRINLSLMYSDLGQSNAAIDQCLAALRIVPGDRNFLQRFVTIARNCSELEPTEALMSAVESCLQDPGINQQDLVDAGLMLALSESSIRDMVERGCAGEPLRFSAILDLPDTSQYRILLLLLRNVVLADVRLEKFLVALRAAALEEFADSRGNISRHADSSEQAVLASLAHQCFNNEYVYFTTSEEAASIAALVRAAADPGACSVTHALLIAMYQPLADISQPGLAGIPEVTSLAEKLIDHYSEERRLVHEIRDLTGVSDRTSAAVRAQYEESPYPRWQSVNISSPRPCSRVLAEMFPHYIPADFGSDEIEILIAGCGTGSHAIQTATRFSNCRVTAIDLSRSSIAYAMRKTRELGIENIEYYCGDILELHDLDKRFNIIESVGVLHHMQDPAAGLRNLRGLLVPGGLMHLGFYSTLARSSIYAVRDHYNADEILPGLDQIRRVRRELMDRTEGDVLRDVVDSRDFYSLSECRDLLFHVQEHSYGINGISKMLAQNSLEFIGFELTDSRTRQAYLRDNPGDPLCSNLTLWDAFEKKHPGIFAGMYVFWCRAPSQ